MPGDANPTRLSHLDADGAARMVDVSAKEVTPRQAEASAVITLTRDALDALMGDQLPKKDALATARIAGIQAAKRTADWIPLCHPLSLDWVRIDFSRIAEDKLSIVCIAKTASRTGVEMEALTGVAAAALTVYDMAKAADKAMVIGPIQLERKTGGKSGTYDRAAGDQNTK